MGDLAQTQAFVVALIRSKPVRTLSEDMLLGDIDAGVVRVNRIGRGNPANQMVDGYRIRRAFVHWRRQVTGVTRWRGLTELVDLLGTTVPLVARFESEARLYGVFFVAAHIVGVISGPVTEVPSELDQYSDEELEAGLEAHRRW